MLTVYVLGPRLGFDLNCQANPQLHSLVLRQAPSLRYSNGQHVSQRTVHPASSVRRIKGSSSRQDTACSVARIHKQGVKSLLTGFACRALHAAAQVTNEAAGYMTLSLSQKVWHGCLTALCNMYIASLLHVAARHSVQQRQ